MTATLVKSESTRTEVVREMVTKARANKDCLRVVKDALASQVLVDKYLLHDYSGKYAESRPDQMWERLATAIAEAEAPAERKTYKRKFRRLLDDWKFVPGGRILYGLGNPYVNVTLKNCYVIAIEDDSIKGIFDTCYRMAETYKSGGGCGIDISPLRPRGEAVRNAARHASGPVSFMELFSRITGTIGQQARIGALLICIDVSHPDVEEFITIKGDDLDKVRYANVSVKITDEFMQAVESDSDFELCWGGKIYKKVKARELWGKIIHYAWKRAEPGLLFWDTTRRFTPADVYEQFRSIATNPCGETPLSHGDSCNLGSMNLGKYVVDPFTEPEFDFVSFDRDVRTAVRFLDNIITLEKSPMEFQQSANDNGRRLGLGIMGLADMLIQMKMCYGSGEALVLTESVMDCFMTASYSASCDLAEEKGSFPAFNAEKHLGSEFIQRLPDEIQSRIRDKGLRNISLNAIAPTGSISCISGCSSGIEPVFRMSYIRKTNLGTAKKVKEHEVFHPTAAKYVEQFGETSLPGYFVEAHDIDPDARIKLQAAIQRRVDLSISNTVNLAEDVEEGVIGHYYMQAWRSGCKGITVYRENSREGVLVDKKSPGVHITVQPAPKRPDELDAVAHIIKPNGRQFTVFVGLLEGRVYEVFALDHNQSGLNGLMNGARGKIKKVSRKDPKGNNVYNFESGLLTVRQLNRYEDQEASLVTRMLSTALRHGTPLEYIIDQIVKSKVQMSSFAKAIARALSLYIKQEEVEGKFKCPECGQRNVHFEGTCVSCRDCGYSRCG